MNRVRNSEKQFTNFWVLHANSSDHRPGANPLLRFMEPDGSLDENAQYLCDWLQKTTAEKVILASISKGGSDIKRAIQLCA
ncbi:MAG: hypothetical protein KDK34_05725, partial [Leptospiraceae bacterium]|nr:hypothetical protein [Leptospiraceae bacterium]